MKLCTNCILPETFPGITFDDAGVCSHCRQYDGTAGRHREDKARYAEKFAKLLAEVCAPALADARAHDVLMAYSGGKDSTYTMLLLRRKHGLRVLALSVDNGFVSPRALENIRAVTDALGVDHLLLKPRWDVLRTIFRAAASEELFARKTLDRASTICTSCIGIVKAYCLRVAIEQGIPLVGFGWSPGQAPVQSSIMRTNPAMTRASQLAILAPLRRVAGEAVNGYFLEERHHAHPEAFPTNVHPLAWEHYNEEEILAEIAALGWLSPGDTDSNSSNCLLNAFANEVHLRRYQFHPYVWEIANMVREGVLGRDEGLQKIYGAQPEGLRSVAEHRLFGEP
ncbi:MAG TPA: hypothetical protein VN317_03650 [Candidatus Methanoperedens sp.]|nr:hypothetical protein [Candidatus Methanoperedens sp.]